MSQIGKQTENSYLVLLVKLSLMFLCLSGTANGYSRCPSEPSCDVTRIHSMKSADCYRRDFKSFPKCLTKDAEVIDLTYNRIREIKRDDLRRYSDLKFLYLGENMITRIDEEAFDDKDSLQTLDLSYNAFSSTLPRLIFHLPSLKNLYLSQNQNINVVDVIESAAPLSSPLEHLDISFNQYDADEAQKLPIMGQLPTLLKYNVSGMDLKLTTAQFAGLCNLEILVNDNATAYFDEPCHCWLLQTWLRERHVRFTPFACTMHPNECAHLTVPQEDLDQFSGCKQRHAEHLYNEKVEKALMISASCFVIVLLVSLLVLWRWRRSKLKRRKLQRSIIKQPF